MNTHKCAKRYSEKTNDGTILPTKTEQRAINIDCASVSLPQLLVEHNKKQSGEPLHESSSLINNFYDNIGTEIQIIEADDGFLSGMQDTKREVKDLLDRLAISEPKERKNDPQFYLIMIPIHNKSRGLRSNMGNLLKKIQALEDKRNEKKIQMS